MYLLQVFGCVKLQSFPFIPCLQLPSLKWWQTVDDLLGLSSELSCELVAVRLMILCGYAAQATDVLDLSPGILLLPDCAEAAVEQT